MRRSEERGAEVVERLQSAAVVVVHGTVRQDRQGSTLAEFHARIDLHAVS